MEKRVKKVPGFPGYLVSNYGEIYSLWEGKGPSSKIGFNMKRLSTSIDDSGREVISLSKKGKSFSKKVCWIVLEAFVGPRPPGMQVCHFPDRSPANNRLDNLRWDTPSSNYADRVNHGTCNRGSRNGSNKLSSDDVIEIRKKRGKGLTYKALSREYFVSLSNIQQICERRIWKWL